MKAKFIGKIADHHRRASLYEYLDKTNNIIEVERDNINNKYYNLITNNNTWSFSEDELEFLNDIPLLENKIQKHLKGLISKMPDRLSCIAYITGYSKYNPDVEKDDLIYILQYILENK